MATKTRSASSRKRLPVCGFEFDGETCRKRGDHFCKQRADRVQAFFEEVLVHTKGRFARQPFVLTDWQRDDIIRPLFGTVMWSAEHKMYVRLYLVAWIEIARKNGKSELLAGIALYLLVADGEESAEIYGCAKDTKQARKVWDVAKRMMVLSPTLNSLWKAGDLKINLQEKRIVYEPTASYYEVITADAAGELGHNPNGIVFDEVLTQPNGDLWDALKTAMGTRVQPLLAAATTAGNDPSGFAASEHEFSERISNDADLALRQRRFVYMRNTPKDADWKLEKNWHIANPALGDFLSLEALRQDFQEALEQPSKENAFRQFRLNQWVQQFNRWMPLHRWDLTAGIVDEDDLVGEPCYGGLDLASSIDIAALCWDFPDIDGAHDAIWRFWIPEAQIKELDKRTGNKASVWIRQGFIEVTEGDVIDYKAILAQIDRDATKFEVRELAYDPWGMTQLAQDIEDYGMDLVPFRQGFKSMSPPTKEWERLIYQLRYRHGGNPVMRWMIDNIVTETDPAGNIKINRKKSSDKVDGAIAAVMALDTAIRNEGGGPSVMVVGPQ